MRATFTQSATAEFVDTFVIYEYIGRYQGVTPAVSYGVANLEK